jgi:DNA-binding GntR family transcriptional regulator
VTLAQERTLVDPVVAPVGDRFRYLDHYVYDALLEAIVQGRLGPGTRLVLDDLADQLRVSRTPIRDALRRLASEGLVHRSGRQGFTVVSLSRDELAELYEVRLMCELFAVEYGIANASASLVDQMAMTADQGFRELRRGNSFAASLKDGQFHQLVVSLCQNRKLTSLFEPLNIHIQTLRVRPAQEKLSNRRQHYQTEHAAIIEALRAQDVAAAKDAVRFHILAARDRAVAALDAQTDGRSHTA